MVELLPKWVMKRFLTLHAKFGEKTFDFEQAVKVLKKEMNDDKPIVSLVLSDLRKAGWMKINISQEDARKREYTLVAPTIVFKEYIQETQQVKK
ncbi:hypothetical protein HY095_00795 [Candidatus Micrarchaeota archaeon]|nr:hypothetical protein [Candidatus Micrarchaeota archaeon]